MGLFKTKNQTKGENMEKENLFAIRTKTCPNGFVSLTYIGRKYDDDAKSFTLTDYVQIGQLLNQNQKGEIGVNQIVIEDMVFAGTIKIRKDSIEAWGTIEANQDSQIVNMIELYRNQMRMKKAGLVAPTNKDVARAVKNEPHPNN